jgi:hypothetical protein
MVLSPRPARQARLSRSVEKAFGELFTIEAFKPTDNVNGRYVADVSRPTLVEVRGVWHGPTKSSAPNARGSASDESASHWRVSRPEVHFDDVLLLWQVQMGDRVTRLLDGSVYTASAPYPNGFGRTVIPLTSRKS